MFDPPQLKCSSRKCRYPIFSFVKKSLDLFYLKWGLNVVVKQENEALFETSNPPILQLLRKKMLSCASPDKYLCQADEQSNV